MGAQAALEATPARLAAARNLLVNCAGITAGSEVLFINEHGKGVDPSVVAFLEEQVGVPIRRVGVGPGREQFVVRSRT